MDVYRSALQKLADALEQVGETSFATIVRDKSNEEDTTLTAFLVSNELWGGAGSIADQAGIGGREAKRVVEKAMIELGELQLKGGITNVRTKMWTSVFIEWKLKGI
ncbi:MAG: hypothetical protein HYX71_11550 [Opitutae bacterium]|nr:hypothetical protein [Opitutae bacterium]